MQPFLPIHLNDHHFLLTAGRTIFWEEKKSLILSDLHLGKAGHFRKSGIGIPQTVFMEDLHRLVSQIQYFNPEQLIIVGDLFHSTANKEHELFFKWRKDFPSLSIQLVMGNHDILADEWYRSAGIDLHFRKFELGGFIFTHDIESSRLTKKKYHFSGHVHPGVILHGSGKQSLRMPCFYFGKDHAILPAFGRFTGTHAIQAKKGDQVVAIVGDRLMKIQ